MIYLISIVTACTIFIGAVFSSAGCNRISQNASKNDPVGELRGPWSLIETDCNGIYVMCSMQNLNTAFACFEASSLQAFSGRNEGYYALFLSNGATLLLPKQSCFVYTSDKMKHD